MSIYFPDTINHNQQVSSQVQENTNRTISETTSTPQISAELEANHGSLSVSDSKTYLIPENRLSVNRLPRNYHAAVRRKTDFRCSPAKPIHLRQGANSNRHNNDISNFNKDSATLAFQEPKPEKICRFFYKYGYCKFDSNCRFLHKEFLSGPSQESRNERFIASTSGIHCADEITDSYSEKPIRDENRYRRRNYRTYYRQGRGKTTVKKSHAYQKDTTPEDTSGAVYLDRNSDDQDHSEVEKTDLIDIDHQSSTITAPEPVPSNLSQQRKKKPRPCWFFKQFGTCRYGDSCRYKHSPKPGLQKVRVQEEECGITAAQDFDPEDGIKEEQAISESCENDTNEKGIERPQVPRNPPEQLSGLYVHKIESLTNDDLKSLRHREITQLKKRFPQCETLADTTFGNEFIFEFLPSDPDWPFEVKSLEMKIVLTSDYPLEPCIVKILDTNDRFPDSLIRFLDQSIETWIKNRHEETLAAKKVELVFKTFLRWLDRNLEDLFISGLKKVKKEKEAKDAGIEFIPYESLRFSPSSEPSSQDAEEQNPTNDTTELNEITMPSDAKAKETSVTFATVKRGTEVVLRGLELGENAATLVCRKIAVTLQCGRCKNRNDIECPANRASRVSCARCHHVQILTFRPQMLHQFGCIMGYLDLSGCQVVDLPIVNCNFDVGCLNCSRTMSYNGLHYGQRSNVWCSHCNSKMIIYTDSVKFHQLQPSTVKDGKLPLIKLECKDKRVKDPAIQEGKPLPSDGTCKHYKKSYRWLRFPCCGKAYPCDKCHNESETDHEMKYATRMICGFCAKEQPYASEKECVLCKSSMTKKSTTHWEGGKGCRDKLTMSRDDQHKYSGTNKTISRKVQEKTKPPSKK